MHVYQNILDIRKNLKKVKLSSLFEPVLFYICTDGVLGQRRPAQINPRGDGTFDVVYYPDAEGPLKVDVLYGGKPVRDRYTTAIFCIYICIFD